MPAKTKEPADQTLTPVMKRADQLCIGIEGVTKDLALALARIDPMTLDIKTAAEAAYIYKRVRDAREALQEALAPLASDWSASGVYDKLQKEIVPQAFEREGIASFTSAWGFRVGVAQRYYASMKDKEAGMAWLKANGLADLIQPTVNASTLSSAGKAMLDEGKELPEEIFECFFQPSTSLTKVKAK